MDEPLKALGTKLRDIRKKSNETIAEVALAVEAGVELLARIENGQELPSEELLMMILNHFNVQDDLAVQIWDLAGYDNQKNKDDTDQQRSVVMLMTLDSRIIYSDEANVTVSKNGLVMNFLQGGGNQPLPIARVGMSLEQARNVFDNLQQALGQAHLLNLPKRLPAYTAKKPKKPASKKQIKRGN